MNKYFPPLIARAWVLCFVIASTSMAAETTGQVVSWGAIVMPYVKPGTKFTKISAGLDHAMALTTDNLVIAWGGNNSGDAVVPIGLSNALDVASGRAVSVVLNSDGTVTVWG
ncbi:MAG TPA: hypothetical protein VN761_00735, partial [Candidatus Polarisedimenticolia bacterium]|nr:hypothetical protein [Candidatus Polarisedimenticolia bacterium]